MIYSKIAGTGRYLPEKILTNADLEKMVAAELKPAFPALYQIEIMSHGGNIGIPIKALSNARKTHPVADQHAANAFADSLSNRSRVHGSAATPAATGASARSDARRW